MQKLKPIIESLLDNEDELTNDEGLVRVFLNKNYNFQGGTLTIRSDKDHNFIVDYTGKVKVINRDIEELTNGLFVFGHCKEFLCNQCSNLKSLKGGPMNAETFEYHDCPNLVDYNGLQK